MQRSARKKLQRNNITSNKKTRSSERVFYFLVLQVFTYSATEREEQRRRESEPQAPEFVRSRWCALFFCTKATSGIMRRRRLMCESRVCPHPKGFADSKRGKHVRKGDIFLICSHSHNLIYKKRSITLHFFKNTVHRLRQYIPKWKPSR